MPSSLTDPEMDNLVRYISSGKPALIFDDPFPMTFSSQFGVSNAPKQPKPRPGGQMAMFGQQQQPPPKADGGRATRLLEALDLRWEYDNVTFDTSNPHPEFEMLPAEYVFVTRDGENPDSFNSGSEITKGLQELIAIYAGAVEHRDANGTKYRPLLQTGFDSGILTWEEFVDEGGFNMFQMQPSANPKRKPLRKLDKSAHTIAAHVTSDKGKKVNAIFVSDIDMISDFFFQERSLGNLGFKFDNVTFVLNAVDALAGDESFIKLRSRRARHRTLELVEGMKRGFSEEANKAQKEADKEASDELEKRREQLGEQVKQIEENESLDPIARTQLLRQAQQAQQQRMSLAEAQIEQRKNDSIRKINADENRKVASIESRVRVMAIVFPPIPAFLVGIAVLILRWSSENKNIVASRRR
jgi:ABC-2 type transport system permease protein